MFHSETQPRQSALPLAETATLWRGRIAKVALALLLGTIGYFLAPADLRPGEYNADISVTLDGIPYTVRHTFQVGDEPPGEAATVTAERDGYTIRVEGPSAIRYRLDERIAYRVQVLDPAGTPSPIPFQAAASTIHGPAYTQSLPPTERVDGWLVFSMRVPYKARVVTALLLALAVLWLTEVVPLAAAAMLIPVVAVVAGVTDEASVLAPFSNSIIALFMGGFLLAEAMQRTGVDRRIALLILNRSSLKPAYLLLTFMLLTAFLSMWMSNTAAVALVLPIALAVLQKIPDTPGAREYTRALVLAVAYSATAGGVGSAIGTPANLLAMTFMNSYVGTSLTFVNWFGFGLPFLVLMLPIMWLYLLLSFRTRTGNDALATMSRQTYAEELQRLGPATLSQKIVLALFVVIMGFWVTEGWHQIPTAIVALAGAVALFFFGLLRQEDLNRINWNALLTFGGGLAIGMLLVSAGVSDWIALHLVGMAALPSFLVILLVAGLTTVLGAFISNTACAAMLIPLAIPLAQVLGLDPRLLVVVVAIASSIDFALITGTPPTMMAYSTGKFTVGDIFRRGAVLDMIGVIVLSLGAVWCWQWLGIITLR